MSDRHAQLGWMAMGMWTYIAANTDAKGRYSADARTVLKRCMTARDDVRLEQVEEAIGEIANAGLLHLYDVDGKRYLVLHKVDKYNPTGALRYKDSEFPEPPASLCKCLSGPEQAQNTPPVSSPSSSSSEEGYGEEVRPVIRHLQAKAKEAKIPGRKETLISYLESWVARSDAGKVEQILMDPWTRGKTVIEIQDRFFPKNAQDAQEFRSKRDAFPKF